MSLELMETHVATLFRCDRAGRIVAVNQADGPPAPRIFLGRTRHGNLYRLRQDLPASLAAELQAILASEPVAGDLCQPPARFHSLHAALSTHSPVESIWQGPAWYFPDPIQPPDDATAVIVDNPALVQRWFPWLADELAAGIEDSEPCAAVVQGDNAVSVCFSSRTSAHASEAGVETVEAFRGRGFATAAVAAWAQTVRNLGREPLYSTSWDNHASRAVARRLGLILFGVDLHFS